MKLWISKSGDVAIQEQLTTQLILGIVSADLADGERVPSTTQLARQFHIHPNTVRAAYRELVERGWLEWRRGSGFYVRQFESLPEVDSNLDLHHLISTFLNIARGRGHSLDEIRTGVQGWLARQEPDHVVVIEPDPELRQIMVAEISRRSPIPVAGISIVETANTKQLPGGFCVALYDHAEDVRNALPKDIGCLLLRSRSVPQRMIGESRPGRDTLITVISRWPHFLQWARTTLVAVGVDPETLDLRDGRKRGWNRSLTKSSFIICDILAAQKLPASCKPHVFELIADDSMNELMARLK